MKKIFTFLTMLCFLGFLGGYANPGDKITFNFTTNDPKYINSPDIYKNVVVQPYIDGPQISYEDPVELTSNTWELEVASQPLTYVLKPINSDYTIFIKDKPSQLSGTLQLNKVYGEGAYQLIVNPNSSTCEVEVVVGYPEVKDPINPISLAFTLPANSDNPFIISSISFLGETTDIADATGLEAAWISFTNQETGTTVENDSPLTIKFASNEEGEAYYEIGGVTAYYATKTNPSKVQITPAWITYTNLECNFTIPYVEGIDKLYVEIIDKSAGWNVTFEVNDPAGVVVTNNDQVVDLDGLSTIINVPVDGSFTFRAAEGWKINEAVYDDGKSVYYTGTTDDPVYIADELRNGAVVKVTVSEVVTEDQYEDSFTVWFEEGEDGEVLFASASYQGGESGAVKEFAELAGTQTVMFDAAAKTTYVVRATPVNVTEYPNVYAYYCGVYRGETPAEHTNLVYSGIPVNGAELSLYVNEPTAYQVVFEGENGASETETNVYTNGVNQLTGWSNATYPWEMLEGTVLTIYVPETYTVSLNEAVIQPVEEEIDNVKDGVAVYEVTVKAYTFIQFSGDNGDHGTSGPDQSEPENPGEPEYPGPETGVNSIDAENAPVVIYNLQGVRVNSENLPAGIYIINGKKAVLK